MPSQSQHDRITRALDTLAQGLFPFVEQELKAVYKDGWHDAARGSFREGRGQDNVLGNAVRWDAHALLTVMWDQWNRVFRHRLGQMERSLISELREYRNRWAHQEAFDFDDAYRIMDGVHRLLTAVNSEQAEQAARDKRDLMRTHFSHEARIAYRKAQVNRKKWQDFAIYATCCASLVYVIIQFYGTNAWFLAMFFVAVFVYLTYHRLASPPPLLFGPHECFSCGRIIYGETCPYCEAPRPQVLEVIDPAVTRSREERTSRSA